MRYLSITVIPICVGVMLASPWLMQLFGGQKYEQGWPVLVLLSAVQIGYALYGSLSQNVFVQRKPIFSLVCEGTVGVVNYASATLLISHLGLFGVAWGQLIGYVCGIAAATYLLRPVPALRYDWTSLRM